MGFSPAPNTNLCGVLTMSAPQQHLEESWACSPDQTPTNQRFILVTPQLTGHRSHQFSSDEVQVFSESDGLRSSSQLFSSIYSKQVTVANAS